MNQNGLFPPVPPNSEGKFEARILSVKVTVTVVSMGRKLLVLSRNTDSICQVLGWGRIAFDESYVERDGFINTS